MFHVKRPSIPPVILPRSDTMRTLEMAGLERSARLDGPLPEVKLLRTSGTVRMNRPKGKTALRRVRP
jgi:hypothetical protein